MASAFYEIRVRGTVSSRDLAVFEDVDVRSETIVLGAVEDQAALHGLLDRIRDLGLELLDVRQLGNSGGSGPGPPAQALRGSPRHR